MRIRLSSNESPFGPSTAAVAAAGRAVAEAHRYPDDASARLRAAIGVLEGRPADQVMVGTGSAAVLMDLIPHCCLGHPDVEVVAFARSFVVYRLAAANVGARFVEVPTGGPATHDGPGYARDVEALLGAVTPRTRAVVIDNPANPTAAHVSGAALTYLAERLPEQVTLIVDEAYHHFATGQDGYARVAELDLDHPNVVVLTTFSKAYALAGLRIGAMLGAPEVTAAVDQRRTRFNLTAPAQAAALAALADTAHLEQTVAGTLAGRQRLTTGFAELGLPFSAGLGNFVTVELGTAAGPIVDAYARHGIGVRALAPYDLHEQVRITVGTPDEVEAVLEASASVLAEVPSRA